MKKFGLGQNLDERWPRTAFSNDNSNQPCTIWNMPKEEVGKERNVADLMLKSKSYDRTRLPLLALAG